MKTAGTTTIRGMGGALALAVGLLVSLPVQAEDAAAGARLAQQWCASCHIVDAKQAGTVPQGPPSFGQIARSGMTEAQLRTFLSHPHGAMPDLSLTRADIDKLIAYISTLR